MRVLIAFLTILLTPAVFAQTNVLFGNVTDFGLAPRSNITMTLSIVSPLNRTYNGQLVSNDPKTATTDTNGLFSFTNVIWGNYKLNPSDSSGTVWRPVVGTNTTGTVSFASIIANPSVLPPNPATNYYTQAQIDSIVSGITTTVGLTNGQAGANLRYTVFTNSIYQALSGSIVALTGDVGFGVWNNFLGDTNYPEAQNTNMGIVFSPSIDNDNYLGATNSLGKTPRFLKFWWRYQDDIRYNTNMGTIPSAVNIFKISKDLTGNGNDYVEAYNDLVVDRDLRVSGTNYASVFVGNGSGLTNISSANVSGLGTASYSNATAFYFNSNPSNYVTASITNSLASTNYVNTATNALATTNYVKSATNGLPSGIWTLGTASQSNATAFYLSSNPSSYVTSSITNGLATTNYVNTATNGFVTASVTNGLATTNFVNTAGSTVSNGVVSFVTNNYISATQGATISNSLLSSISSSNAASLAIVTNLIASKTNFDNITVTNYSLFKTNAYFAGDIYVTNHAYDVSTSQLDPLANEYVTASFVRSVLNNGAFLYGTTNTTTVGFSNILTASTNTVSLQFGANAPTSYTKGFTNFVTGTYPNGPYFASIVSTNTYQSVTGPFVNDFYIQADGSGAGHALGIAPDIFVSYDLTNLIPICAGAEQSLTMAATTNLYTWIQSAAQYNSTNAAGFYVVRRVRVTSQNGTALYINVKGGSGTATTLAFNTPVTINANYVGTFIGNGSGLTNLSPTNLVFNCTTQTTAVLNFNLAEIAITNNITFTSATGVASNGFAKYIGATVWGTGVTVAWPQLWSPNNTNSVKLTNGVIAFKCFGTNVFAAPYQP